MDESIPPGAWLGGGVTVGVVEGKSASGRLIHVSDLGITLLHGVGNYEQFYPWTAVRSIRPTPESAPRA
jgi:hypothetical protein